MTDSINPAWKNILDAVPPEFHPVIIPQLQEWDKGIQQKFADIRSEYDELKPYEAFVKNNIDPDYAQQAVLLADQLQRDPKQVLLQVNDAWDLGYVPKEEVARPDDGGNMDFDDTDDIFKNPQVKAMQEALEKIQAELAQQQEQSAEESELAEFEAYLDELETKTTEAGQPFHRTFVTALISEGLDGDEAVKQYHQVLAGATPESSTTKDEEAPPPVVMGGNGTTGSGSPDGSIQFSSLSKNDLTNTVEQLLARAAESGQ